MKSTFETTFIQFFQALFLINFFVDLLLKTSDLSTYNTNRGPYKFKKRLKDIFVFLILHLTKNFGFHHSKVLFWSTLPCLYPVVPFFSLQSSNSPLKLLQLPRSSYSDVDD